MDYYDSMKECSKCGRKTRAAHVYSTKHNDKLIMRKVSAMQRNCIDCEVPPMCHARVGIGVATLGAACCYDEGHVNKNIPHSFYPRGHFGCNKHKDCRAPLV